MKPPGKATTAALVASLGAFLFGLDIGYIAPILESASFKRDVAHLENWSSSDSQLPPFVSGFIVAIFSIGCIIASFPAISSYCLDELGRRSSIILGAVLFLVGCAVQALSLSVYNFCIGRLISGISIGLMSSAVPLYQAEMAPPDLRGTLTSTYQLLLAFGIFIAALLDLFLVNLDGGWKLAIAFQAVPASLILMIMPFLPRSPRWLAQQGRLEEAEASLVDLRSAEGPQVAKKELEEIVEEIKALDGQKTWREVFSGNIGFLVLIGASLQMLQQLVGMNAFMYFGPSIFTSFGYSGTLFQMLTNAVNFLMTIPALFIIETAGRRALLMVGAVGMGISSASLAILGHFAMEQHGHDLVLKSSSPWVGAAMTTAIFSFVSFFAATWGPTVWVYCAEMFPLKYRARCLGVTTMTNWVGNYLIAQFTPVLLNVFGFSVFIIFTFFCGVALMMASYLPETRGLSLEHIGQLFQERFDKLFSVSRVTVKPGYGSTDTTTV
mmetsp:Transcript_56151/g.99995  ORF Transcript_56151/g.99995 Transcript_56151/m.99995 type:complete len:495 (-) Transcript_56151:46-1530(-)|eukprot:CAMPEP_0197655910 /NCGR_PEP_ID=MMETSP1338-20131121/39744_1 /TAXON_ID=43686 ORGANISM="Pelagodinium beii, Strain RCC1491" /NCGR_SAMPLE_ID=MMETSP1338 /ASSEMBLY_ACC=CAM_ASM_000754 /LENGTH=494 /DNA_ID=CAMNT_0043231655 /DNA_START=153 /DNA_END=1637 /DNA_ORIENTATION=+